MHLLEPALRGALRPSPCDLPVQRNLLLLGAGGALGSAVLAEALIAGRFARVQALVSSPLASALRGLDPLQQAVLDADPAGAAAAPWEPPRVLADTTAVLVFERQRHSNGRDDAFVQPDPADLVPLAVALRRHGVRRLLVMVPHAPALLPHALRHGLATLDETAVDALGFERLLFVRAAQQGGGATAGRGLLWVQRAAGWWLSQLHWLVPQQQLPLRAALLARCVVQLAQALPAAAAGTRVLAPEVLQPAPGNDVASAAVAWLQAPRPEGPHAQAHDRADEPVHKQSAPTPRP